MDEAEREYEIAGEHDSAGREQEATPESYTRALGRPTDESRGSGESNRS